VFIEDGEHELCWSKMCSRRRCRNVILLEDVVEAVYHGLAKETTASQLSHSFASPQGFVVALLHADVDE
jgi:hypothetical protein